MIPLRDNFKPKEFPLVTYTLAFLNCAIYFWDRGGLWMADSRFAEFAMRPKEILLVLQGQGDPTTLVTIYTSMFLHGNLAHLVTNLLFLIVFGENVEAALGSVRFALYYVAWGLLAAMSHIYVDMNSWIPTLGASGAIGGVLGAYFLLFPGNRVKFIVFPLFFLPFITAAWVLLGIWFLAQIFLPQQGVANWAHAGGFLAGMLTVILLGGRTKILAAEPLVESNLELEGF